MQVTQSSLRGAQQRSNLYIFRLPRQAFAFLAMTVFLWTPAYAEQPDPVCQIVERHVPANDVAYQAGVDVYGRSVVPADLNAAPSILPKIIKVPLSIDLAKRMNLLVDGLQMEAPLGMLEIYPDGRVRYNDQDWTAPVMTLCGESHKVEQVTETLNPAAQTPVEDDGLGNQDVIKSDAIDVKPLEAIPPQDVAEINIEQLEIEPPAEENIESDIIEGGEYREIYYNE